MVRLQGYYNRRERPAKEAGRSPVRLRHSPLYKSGPQVILGLFYLIRLNPTPKPNSRPVRCLGGGFWKPGRCA